MDIRILKENRGLSIVKEFYFIEKLGFFIVICLILIWRLKGKLVGNSIKVYLLVYLCVSFFRVI